MNSGGEPPPPELEARTDSVCREVEVTLTPSEDEAEKAARTDEEKASPDDASVSTNKRICIADTPHPETEKEEEKGQGEAGKRFTVSVRGRRNRRLSPSSESLSPLLRNVRSPHHHT